MTPSPGKEWMEQQARNATMEEWGFLRGCRYLLHDRDTKFCASFRELIESGSRNDSLASEEPELEFVCGALGERKAAVRCRERLGGLLKHYEREAAAAEREGPPGPGCNLLYIYKDALY